MATAAHPRLEWVGKEEYRKRPGISTSQLKRFTEDPYAYHLGLTRPTSAAMQWGCDFENFLLLGELPDIVRMPPEVKVRRGKVYDTFVAEYPGKRLLKADEFDELHQNLLAAAEQVEQHKDAATYLATSLDCWPSIYWECPLTFTQRKAELDMIVEGTAIVDLKTCQDVSYYGFSSQAERLKYHWQAASYQQAVEVFSGQRLPVVFLCVQNSPPYNVECYEMPQGWIDEGLQEVAEAIRRLQQAERTKVWRSPTWGTTVQIERPRWAKYQQAIEVEV